MTVQRRDHNGSPFGDWLRAQAALDSRDGWLASDLDMIWLNTATGEYMHLETKCRMAVMKEWQRRLFRDLVRRPCLPDTRYRGFHLLQFEATNPLDGATYIDGRRVTLRELLDFLAFSAPADWYHNDYYLRY